MKRLAILLAGVLLLASCKQQFENTKEAGEYGTVVISFSPNYTVRSIGENALPNIAGSKMKIVVEGGSSSKIEKEYDESAEKRFEEKFPVGATLKVTVTIMGHSGEWKGSGTHTVQKGANPVSIKLKRSATSLKALKFAVKEDGQRRLSFELGFSGGTPFFNENISLYYARGNSLDYKVPAFCRDRLGRTYIYYAQDVGVATGSQDYHLKRFTSEGEWDNKFPVDSLTNGSLTYFDVISDHVSGNVLKVFSKDSNKKTIKIKVINEVVGEIPDEVTLSLEKELLALAVRNNVFAVVMNSGSPASPSDAYQPVLKLYKYEGGTIKPLQETVVEMKDTLKTKVGESNEVGNVVDLVMKDDAIYVLYALKKDEKKTSFGGVLKYPYSTEAGIANTAERIIGKTEYELKDKAVNVQDEGAELFGALKFVGFSEDELYVADDGGVYEYDAGEHYVAENKNRLVALNTKTKQMEIKEANLSTWLPEEKVLDTTQSPILFYSREGDPSSSGSWKESIKIHMEGENGIAPTASLTLPGLLRPDMINYVFDSRGNFYIVYATNTSGVSTKLAKYSYDANGQHGEDLSFAPSNQNSDDWKELFYDSKQRELYLKTENGELYRYEGRGKVPIKIDTSAKESAFPIDRGKTVIYDGKISSYFKVTPDSATSFWSYKIKDDAVVAPASDDYSEPFKKIEQDSANDISNFLAYDDHFIFTYENNKEYYVATINMETKKITKKLLYDKKLDEKNCDWIGYNKAKKEVKFHIDDVEKDYDERVLSNLDKYVSCKVEKDNINTSINDAPTGIIWNKTWKPWKGTKNIMLSIRGYAAGTVPEKEIDPALSDEASYYAVEENNLNEGLPSTPSIETNSGSSGDTLNQFCYDQLGNLYVLHHMNSEYDILRFKLQDDGTYNFGTPVDVYKLASLGAPFDKGYFRMAVAYVGKDSNDEDRFVLYHTGKSVDISTDWKIQINAVEFTDNTFSHGTENTGWQLTVPLKDRESIGDNWYVHRDLMALSANKDGLFLAMRERERREFDFSGNSVSVDRAYNIQVRKYDLTGSRYKEDVKGVVNVVGTPEKRVSTEAYSNFSVFGNQGLKVEFITPNKYIQEFVKDMFAYNGKLYILTNSKIGGDVKTTPPGTTIQDDKALMTMYSTGAIWKASSTNEFTGDATLIKKAPEGDEHRGTFAPLHFVAIMPKRLAIASDGFFVDTVLPLPSDPNDKKRRGKNSDKVLFLNVENSEIEEKETRARFEFSVLGGEDFPVATCGWGWSE